MTLTSALNLAHIVEARDHVRGVAERTQLYHSLPCSAALGFPTWLKLENLQRTGSFKIRGAYNRLRQLSEQERAQGVMTVSAGNHAQGVALAASLVGTRAVVFMPETASLKKFQATRRFGAEVIGRGTTFDEAYQAAMAWREENPLIFVPPFDDDAVIAGQGTTGLEILEDLPEAANVIVPIGGGGLISGIAMAIKEQRPGVRVIGVQTEAAPAMYESFRARQLVSPHAGETIADGIAIKRPCQRTFELIQRYVDDVVLVSEEDIARAILFLLEENKLVVEGAGAAAWAALLQRRIAVEGNTVVVVSGGNIDSMMMAGILEKGLVEAGRYQTIYTRIDDYPGSLYQLLGVLAHHRANIQQVRHERLKPGIPMRKTDVEVSFETRDHDHVQEILRGLRDAGYEPEIQ